MAKLSLIDLLAQRAALEKQIQQTQRSERAEAIAQVRSLMSQYGLTAADLSAKPGAASKRVPKAPKAVKAVKATGPGKKVAAKYRDASTGQTWSGRGLRPNWLKAALATGRPLSDFAL